MSLRIEQTGPNEMRVSIVVQVGYTKAMNLPEIEKQITLLNSLGYPCVSRNDGVVCIIGDLEYREFAARYDAYVEKEGRSDLPSAKDAYMNVYRTCCPAFPGAIKTLERVLNDLSEESARKTKDLTAQTVVDALNALESLRTKEFEKVRAETENLQTPLLMGIVLPDCAEPSVVSCHVLSAIADIAKELKKLEETTAEVRALFEEFGFNH